MGMFGGAGAGGWSSGIGGQATGPMRHSRGSDGWDDEYLGKAYDAQVVRRILPYLKPYKMQASLALACMIISAVTRNSSSATRIRDGPAGARSASVDFGESLGVSVAACMVQASGVG